MDNMNTLRAIATLLQEQGCAYVFTTPTGQRFTNPVRAKKGPAFSWDEYDFSEIGNLEVGELIDIDYDPAFEPRKVQSLHTRISNIARHAFGLGNYEVSRDNANARITVRRLKVATYFGSN